MINLVVKSLVIGNSGEYNALRARGYESIGDSKRLQDAVARFTMDGAAISQASTMTTETTEYLHTSNLVGADIAVDGNLSERRNVFHMVIDDVGLGGMNPTARYLVTGYISPGSVVDGKVLPNAPLYLNNVMRMVRGPKGWQVRDNILTHITTTESGTALNPFDSKKRSKIRLEDVTHRAYTSAREGGITDEPILLYNADVSNEFVTQSENLVGSAFGNLVDTYADAAQAPDALSSTEMFNRARTKLTTVAAGNIVRFLQDEAGLSNGMVYYVNLTNAFGLGPHNVHIENDGSQARLNTYDNPNSATNEARIAYTVANNFGHCALGAGIVVAECTFTNNALYDHRFGCNFAFNMNDRPYYACEDMDETHAVDSMMMAVVREILPHVSEGHELKTTVRVSFGAYKDIIITVDCGGGEETFVFPAFSSSGYNLTVSGSQHGETTMTRLALAVNQVVGIGDDLNNNPIGMSEINQQSFTPTAQVGVDNVSMPSQLTLGGETAPSNKPKFTLG